MKITRSQRFKLHQINKERATRGLKQIGAEVLFMSLGEAEDLLINTPNSNYPYNLYDDTLKNNGNIVNLKNFTQSQLEAIAEAGRTRLRKNQIDAKIKQFTLNPLDIVNVLQYDKDRNYLMIVTSATNLNAVELHVRNIDDAGNTQVYTDTISLQAAYTLEFSQIIPVNAISFQNKSVVNTVSGFVIWG